MDSARDRKHLLSSSKKKAKPHALCPLKCNYCTHRFYNVSSYRSHVKSHEKRYQKYWFNRRKHHPPTENGFEPGHSNKEEVGNKLNDGVTQSKHKVFVYLVYPPGSLCDCNKENVASKMPCHCDFTYRRKVYSSIHQMHQSMQHGIGYSCKQCGKHAMRDLASETAQKDKKTYVVCPRCGDRFARNADFEKHHHACSGYSEESLKKAGDEEDTVQSSDLQCIVCGCFCPDDVSLNDHVKSHAEVKSKADDPAGKVTVIWKNQINRSPSGKKKEIKVPTDKDSIASDKLIGCHSCRFINGCQCQKLSKNLVPIAPKPETKLVLMYECNTCKMKFLTMKDLENHKVAFHTISFARIAPTADKGQVIVPVPVLITPAGVPPNQTSGNLIQSAKLKTLRPKQTSEKIAPLSIRPKENKPSESKDNPEVATKFKPSEDHNVLQYKWKCEECPETFKCRDDLRLHVRLEHRKGQVFRGKDWRCEICDKIFPSRDKWKSHQKVHKSPTKQMWMCNNCGFYFVNEWRLTLHRRETHPDIANVEQTKSEEYVDIPFLSFSRKLRSMKSTNCDNNVTKANASEVQSGSSKLNKKDGPKKQSHLDTTGEKPDSSKSTEVPQNKINQESIVMEMTTKPNSKWKCMECSNIFKNRDDLRLHTRLEHRAGVKIRGKEWQCLICNTILATRDRWKKHGQIHKGEQRGACTDCGIYFDTRQKFTTHLKDVHGTSSVGDEHSYTAVGEEVNESNDGGVWPCNACSLTFKSRQEQRRHFQTQHRESDMNTGECWPCIECPSLFRSLSELRMHVKAKHEESTGKKWECKVCLISFDASDQLQEHRRDHVPSKSIDAQSKNRWACSECGEILGTRDELRLHRKGHLKNEHSQKCTQCGWVFGTNEELNSHSEDHMIDFENLRCCECNIDFTTYDALKTHLETHSDFCQLCGLKFTTVHNREKHIKVCALEGKELAENSKCPECGEEFVKSIQLRLHIARHIMKKEKLKCKLCSKEFQNLKEVELHKQDHKTDCQICLKKFATHHELSEHEKTHVSCKHCDKKFENYSSCKRHMSTYCHEALAAKGLGPRRRFPSIPPGHKIKTVEKCDCICDQCGKRFTSIEGMKKHRIIHFRHKFSSPKKCPDCDLMFEYATQLRMHQEKVHWPETPYACMYCRNLRRFKTSSDLKQHELTHIADKPHSCPMCNRKFKETAGLRYHLNTHTGIKPYKCNYCPKTFCQPGQKKTHERRHEGYRPYKCHVCTCTYTYGQSLKIHLQTHVRKGELDKLPEVIHSEELQAQQRARNEAIKAAKRERVRLAKEAKQKGISNTAATCIGPTERIVSGSASEEERVFEIVTQEVIGAERPTDQLLLKAIVEPTRNRTDAPVAIPPQRSSEEHIFETMVAHVQSLGSQSVNNNVASWNQGGHSEESSQWQTQVVGEALVEQQGGNMEDDGAQQMHGQQGEESAAAALYNMIQR